eukprot:m.312699 g.312699  ORF g.312699 m.312699 type:complete len:69 (-) comp55396_c0_seq2:68-274(-)
MYDALASHMFCSLNLQQSCGADEPDSNVEQEPANRTHDVFPEQPLEQTSVSGPVIPALALELDFSDII